MPARSCSISFADPGILVSADGVSATGEEADEGIVWATVRKKSSMYWRDAGSYYDVEIRKFSGKKGGFQLTSTGYVSPSWKEFICPSGRRPLGNKESRTNSGSVKSSSLERVNFVPLSLFS